MNKLILASGSPRRREILEKNGYKPEIMKMDVDETLPEGISFRDAVMFLSLKKGLAAEEALKSADTNASTDAARPDLSDSNASAADASSGDRFLILSADTVVYKDGILGSLTTMTRRSTCWPESGIPVITWRQESPFSLQTGRSEGLFAT